MKQIYNDFSLFNENLVIVSNFNVEFSSFWIFYFELGFINLNSDLLILIQIY